MRLKFQRFMYGRYGLDNLSRFLNVLFIVVLLVSMFISGLFKSILLALAIAGVIYSYYRFFSKNIVARRKENAKYLKKKQQVSGWFSLRREIWRQRREFRFFKCPSCKAVLRVPKRKGRIRIVCKKCGTAFEKKT